ncbi:MAG: asparagine synthase (glutamine-hydrolyzing) [Verrucomicrobiota bacterium]|nr:asparagine synthase (glutamine-hydrolyzing) [Verrucomicrobiota bacterium]
MCGIAGFAGSENGPDRAAILTRMTGSLRHRGPDDDGFFFAPGVGLGMRRLSIVDVDSSQQPIANEDGSVHVIFNGEIYNYVELRASLQQRGHTFTTQGDTETLVHLYEEYGTEMLRHLRGMFAFALWDGRDETLFLARDRLGKKPLNYVVADGTLFFSSELAPLLDAKLAPWELDPASLAAYLLFGFVSAPQSMVRQIRKLPPAHFLTWRRGQMEVRRYWSYTQAPKLTCSRAEALDLVRETLDESIRLRLRSDVAVGLLLSGGLDSNAILARLVHGLGRKVQAFTIGFTEQDYDESEIARASAKHFGIEHHVLTGGSDLLKLLPDVVRHYGEPSADKSVLPTMRVCELTREFVKVALSGDGGDEAFSGYSKHRLADWQRHSSTLFSSEIREQWTLASMTGEGRLGSKFASKIRRQLLAETPSLFSGEFFSGPFFREITTSRLRDETLPFLHGLVARFWAGRMPPIERILQWDNTDPLPNSLLTKLDIASMAQSLEVRSPFLDHELVELCARLPNDWKGNQQEGKLMLRELVSADLPSEVLNAPKRGFSVPLSRWWRNEARGQIREGLLPLHPALTPYVDEQAVARFLEEHQQGRANHAQRLWNLWVLNEWARMFF